MHEGEKDDDLCLSAEVLAALPLFPLPEVVFFPRVALPLHVFEPRYREMMDFALAHHRHIGVVLLKPGYAAQYHGRPPVHGVLTAGRLVKAERLADGRWNIVLRGVERVRIAEEHQGRSEAFRLARVESLPDLPSPVDRAAVETLRALVLEIARVVPEIGPPVASLFRRSSDPVRLCHELASRLVADTHVQQALLEERDPSLRLERLVEVFAEIRLRLVGPTPGGGAPLH